MTGLALSNGFTDRSGGGQSWRLTVLSVLRTVSVLLGVAAAAVNRSVIDAATSVSSSVWLAITLFVLVQILANGVSMGLNWFSTVLGERLSNNIREHLYRIVLGARWSRLSGYHSEQLLTRLTSDISSIASGLTGTAVSLLAVTVQAVAAFALLLHYDSTLALFVVILTPVAMLTSAVVSVRLRILQQQVQQAEADYRERAQETIAHIEVVKAFDAQADEARALSDLQRTHEKLLRRRARLSVIANGIMSAAFIAAYLFAFIHGILGIMAGTTSYGTFTAFLTLVSQVQSSLAGLSGVLPRAASVLASTARVREVALLEQEESTAESSADVDGSSALGIRAVDLTFSYGADKGAGIPVLDGAAFSIEPGEVVALMGPSGRGKTTLVRLLLGLLEPQRGTLELTCEGKPIACAAARSHVGYVPQGNTLFSGTIRDNLLMGNRSATDEELWEALDKACAAEFVRSLPGGLDARIGERGLGISEGQAQRIALARAFTRPAGLLILDEATSALDEETELNVMHLLRSRSPHTTCLVITHRTEVIPFCDRVLEFGEDAESACKLVDRREEIDGRQAVFIESDKR